MYQYSSKKQNKEIDQIKNLLDIARGKKTLNEDYNGVDTSAVSQQNQGGMPPTGDQPLTDIQSTNTNDMSEIEKAILNSICKRYETVDNETIVEGIVNQNGKLAIIFNYSSNDTDPKIKTQDAVFLSEELLKSVTQIGSYFSIWKENLNNQ